ncbi:MAG: phosphohydrolase [Bacteroidia bacterium]
MDFEGLKKHVFALLEEQLPENLRYHGLHHTHDVLDSVERYIQEEGISNTKDQILLRTGAVMHDSGFIVAYQNHEENGVKLAKEILPKFGYSASDIDVISGLIMATKVPQSPQNHLEEVLCDCDLDYLGRDDFEEISETLYHEWKDRGMVTDLIDYDTKQVRFLEAHSYFTNFAKTNRAIKKAQQIENLKARLT